MIGHGLAYLPEDRATVVKLVRKLWRATRLLQQAGAMMPNRDQESIDSVTDTVRMFVGNKAECDVCEFLTPTLLLKKYDTKPGAMMLCPDCRKKYFDHREVELSYQFVWVRLRTNTWGRVTSVRRTSVGPTPDGWSLETVRTDKKFMRRVYAKLYANYGPE